MEDITTAGFTTLINVITVEPANQDKLLNYSVKNIMRFMSKSPGFIKVTFLKSLDGKNIVSYGEWEHREDFENMLKTTDGEIMAAELDKLEIASLRNFYEVYEEIAADN